MGHFFKNNPILIVFLIAQTLNETILVTWHNWSLFWAGAVETKLLWDWGKSKFLSIQPTDRPTEQPTNIPTNHSSWIHIFEKEGRRKKERCSCSIAYGFHQFLYFWWAYLQLKKNKNKKKYKNKDLWVDWDRGSHRGWPHHVNTLMLSRVRHHMNVITCMGWRARHACTSSRARHTWTSSRARHTCT